MNKDRNQKKYMYTNAKEQAGLYQPLLSNYIEMKKAPFKYV